ncbi:Ku protein [Paenibacillus thermotolerans]|uniref:non-homologous end joining protein Ku n=1 Tax=Paenibacillus thermotolerans TaxID=3027807 RepID=UPI00236817C7|nr:MULTISPECIES: Ku protein [unclassified Paenibacillus]
MHTIWKGAISFGLVNIPVKMYAATEDKDISMRMLHKQCGTPISYMRRCPTCETPVENEEIVKGYEYEKGRFVRFEKEELDALAAEASRDIKILDFVNLEEIDPIYFQKTYYLGPGDTGANAYGLLQTALKDTGKIGIARVTIRNKSSLAAIRIVENCICMETIFYPDEIRPAAQVPNLQATANVNDKELTMAKMLIEQLSVPFEPDKYHDEYREELMGAIEKKIAGEEIEVAPEPRKNNVIDLMAALQASLEAAKGASPDVKAATDKGAAKAGEAAKEADAKPKRTRKKAAGAEDDAGGAAPKEKTPAGTR